MRVELGQTLFKRLFIVNYPISSTVVVVVVVVNIFCISPIGFHRIWMKFGGKVHHDMKPRKK